MKYAEEKQSYPLTTVATSILTQARKEGDLASPYFLDPCQKSSFKVFASALHEISSYHLAEYKGGEPPGILDEAIGATELRITYISGAGHHPIGENLNLMNLLLQRYLKTEKQLDLDHAIQEDVRVYRSNHPLLSGFVVKLAMLFHLRGIRATSQNVSTDLDQAVKLSDLAIPHCPLTCSWRAELQFNLAEQLIALHHATGNDQYLDRAIEVAEAAIRKSSVQAMPPPKIVSGMSTLALGLLTQYECRKSLDVLNRAIMANEEALRVLNQAIQI